MTGVTGAQQTIPPLQPIFSAHPASITTSPISSGEVIYSTVLTPNVAAVTSNATTTTNTATVGQHATPPPPPIPPPVTSVGESLCLFNLIDWTDFIF